MKVFLQVIGSILKVVSLIGLVLSVGGGVGWVGIYLISSAVGEAVWDTWHPALLPLIPLVLFAIGYAVADMLPTLVGKGGDD